MHIFLMLFLILVGYALGENVSYILGLPIIALGLYVGFGDWGGKQGKRQREQAEGLFVVVALGCGGLILVTELFS
jgi:hypothetical protein